MVENVRAKEGGRYEFQGFTLFQLGHVSQTMLEVIV
jgi:hypothetical protein